MELDTTDLNTQLKLETSKINPNFIMPESIKPRYSFDIMVHEVDDNGKDIPSKQYGVMANSEDELRRLYAMSDQKIEILHKEEINPPENIPQQTQIQTLPQERVTIQPQVTTSKPLPSIKSEPKYFSAGGIKFKLVDEVLYQKQWITASPDESNSIRVITDKTNKIMSMEGKHIEIEKWIRVADEDITETND